MQFHNIKLQEYVTNMLSLSPYCVHGKKYTYCSLTTGQSHVDTNLTMMIRIYSRVGFWIGRKGEMMILSSGEKDFQSWGAERQAEKTASWTEEDGLRLWEWRQHEGDHTDMEGRSRGNVELHLEPHLEPVELLQEWCKVQGGEEVQVMRGSPEEMKEAVLLLLLFYNEEQEDPCFCPRCQGRIPCFQRCCEERSFLYTPQDSWLPVGQWYSKEVYPLRADQTSTLWALLGRRTWSSF